VISVAVAMILAPLRARLVERVAAPAAGAPPGITVLGSTVDLAAVAAAADVEDALAPRAPPLPPNLDPALAHGHRSDGVTVFLPFWLASATVPASGMSRRSDPRVQAATWALSLFVTPRQPTRGPPRWARTRRISSDPGGRVHPSTLEGLVALFGAAGKGKLGPKYREAIALTVSELDHCDYCLSAHSALGRRAGLDDEALAHAREGTATDPRLAAAVRFARVVAEKRGRVTDEDATEARRAGIGDDEILEIVTNVALTTFTNYLNEVAATEIDFPVVHHLPR
jgi:uncharacterized peroxidase-related enzyme